MAVTSVAPYWTGQTGDLSLGAKRQYTAVYRVTCSTPLDNAATIVAFFQSSPSVPGIGSHYYSGNDTDFGAFCNSIAPRRMSGSTNMWLVTLNFETMQAENEEQRGGLTVQGEESIDPLEWRDELSVSTHMISEAVYKAKYLQPIMFSPVNTYGPVMNTAGQVFSPPLEREVPIEVVRIEHYADYFLNDPNNWRGRVNNSNILVNYGYANFTRTWFKHEAKITAFDGTFQKINDVDVWRWSIEIQSKDGGWAVEVPNLGTAARAQAGDPDGQGGFYTDGGSDPNQVPESGLRPLLSATGEPITDPIPLGADGQPQPPGTPILYLKFLREFEAEFATLRNNHGLFGAV